MRPVEFVVKSPMTRARASDDPKSKPHPRALALEALKQIIDRRSPLEIALEGQPGFTALEVRDRAFARLLVATCLRRLGEINALIAGRMKKPLPKSARPIHHLLVLGIAQLVFLKTPAHAAVDTAVKMAARISGGRFKGLVNAILRGIDRDHVEPSPDGPRLNTPEWLWQKLERDYGARMAADIARAHMAEPPLDITLKNEAEAKTWAQRLDAEILPAMSLRRKAGGAIHDLPGYDDGAWWIQDAAAALPVRLFGDVKNKRVLDLCAAPGGKTLQLAARGAEVTALDISHHRLKRVSENLARCGLEATLVCTDGVDFTPDAPFDAVLLDAPCTATGTLRRHPDIAHVKGAKDAASLAPLQEALLATAMRAVKPGGDIIYAVCSLDPAEGEDMVARFLKTHPGLVRNPIDPAMIGGMTALVTPAGDLRTLPVHLEQSGGMDGFYVARLQHRGEAAR